MNAIDQLRDALPTWVRLERRPGQPVVTETTVGSVHVTDVVAFPTAPERAVRADVHFVLVAPTEGLPDADALVAAVAAATRCPGEFVDLTALDLAGGPSYITLGQWLGSQDLALMLIGAAELAGVADAVTPAKLGMTGAMADDLAGRGFVMLGPGSVWTGA